MYLEHYGLIEPPFRITPVTEFFFSGANRGEILDALIYSISEAEGIIKVSGEVGSGKTMLARMLLERLPAHIETIYLANPSLSREEMLYAIADGLGLSIEGERVGVIMRNIENKLEEKAREGKRIVVLVDEAHAMPPDTLEELRLLYNLQVGNEKLLQIVLFGQPELNAKLEQPNMRQLKDRILHHFHMQPLSRDILESYLMFRMRAAGYHGPDIFSPKSLKMIAGASNGLMRRVNILADKSLLAAFIEDTYYIKPQHVEAALRDSELDTTPRLSGKKMLLGSVAVGVLLFGLAAWWMVKTPQIPTHQIQTPSLSSSDTAPIPSVNVIPASDVIASDQPAASSTVNINQSSTSVSSQKPEAENSSMTTSSSVLTARSATVKKTSLFDQRLEAGKQISEQKTAVASIQLFYQEDIKRERIEGFLRRAKALGKLSEIYLIPANFGGKEGIRVLYGAYASIDEAHTAAKDLPERYQEAFNTSTFSF